MSSIYKKGRDGYYYYQVYVFNKETGKNDKRIFYSLGTKSKDEALVKKNVLDNRLKKKNKKNIKQIFLTFLFGSFFLVILYNYPFIKDYQVIEASENKNESHKENYKTKNDSTFSSLIDEQRNTIFPNTIINNNTIKEISLNRDIDFEIIKTEKIQGGFNQIKLFIVVPENSKSDEIRITCEKIKKNHSEYKNIIICVFSNTEKGIDLAKGENFNKSTYSHKEAWLAMYSFNPIEGHYFNNNPSGYLGILK